MAYTNLEFKLKRRKEEKNKERNGIEREGGREGGVCLCMCSLLAIMYI